MWKEPGQVILCTGGLGLRQPTISQPDEAATVLGAPTSGRDIWFLVYRGLEVEPEVLWDTRKALWGLGFPRGKKRGGTWQLHAGN